MVPVGAGPGTRGGARWSRESGPCRGWFRDKGRRGEVPQRGRASELNLERSGWLQGQVLRGGAGLDAEGAAPSESRGRGCGWLVPQDQRRAGRALGGGRQQAPVLAPHPGAAPAARL